MPYFCYGIDIGTNSARLMLAETENGELKSCYKMLRTVRTGEGVNESGRICDAAIQRVVNAMRDFRAQIDGEHPDLPVFCFATSAVRDAANAQELCTAVKQAAGFGIHIIPGNEEAEIGFLGAVPSGTGGIIDIGGGSTEFVHGNGGTLTYRRSFQAGTVRCREMFGAEGDIIGAEKTVAYCEKLFEEIEELPHVTYTGIGGTITSVSAMLQNMEIYDPKKIQGSTVTLCDTEKLLKELAEMPLDARKRVNGLQPERADVIIYGMAVLVAGMRRLNAEQILVSDADNLEGYAIKYKNIISP